MSCVDAASRFDCSVAYHYEFVVEMGRGGLKLLKKLSYDIERSLTVGLLVTV